MRYCIKYFLFTFLIICQFSCDKNNSDLVKKSIAFDDVKISFKIPKDYIHEFDYCGDFQGDIYTISNKKLTYICTKTWLKENDYDSLGDQFLIIKYDNIKFTDDYFETYLKWFINYVTIDLNEAHIIESNHCEIDKRKGFCFIFSQKVGSKLFIELKHGIKYNDKLILFQFYLFDNEKKIKTAKKVMKSVKIE